MEAVVFKLFGVLFKLVGILIVGGTIVTALVDLQRNAFESKRVGLISMLKVNQQLVGKTR